MTPHTSVREILVKSSAQPTIPQHKNPNKRILITKHGFDSTYRCLHWHAR